MSVLAFLLECGAAAAILGTILSVFALLASSALRLVGGRLRADHRADLLALVGLSPALAVTALLLAVTLPSLIAAVTGTGDHCQSHGHHLHLCLLHAGQLRPLLAAIGASALAVAAFRFGASVRAHWLNHRRFAALERLGEAESARFPVVRVPGAPHLCHAVGVFRRRILLSASIEPALTHAELAAALAHERAHLLRHDPLVGTLLKVAGTFMPPPIARTLYDAWQRAAEEACDAHAVGAVGDGPIVASALVKMTALHHGAVTAPLAPAFGESGLERRVGLLLREPAPIHHLCGAAPASFALLSAFAFGLAVRFTDLLHHAVETALHFLS